MGPIVVLSRGKLRIVTERIIANPASELQWGDSIVLMWDRPTAGGRTHGWLLELDLCDLRDCACRTLDLAAQRIDDRLLEVEDVGDELALSWKNVNPGFEPLEVSLDLWTGRVAAPTGHLAKRPDALDTPDARALAASVRGDLLDELWLRLERSKGVRAHELRNRPPPSWEFGNLVRWRDVSVNHRRDLYELEVGRVEAETLLCPVPACDCREVLIDFHPWDQPGLRDEAGRGPSGTVKIQLDEESLPELEPDPGQSKAHFEAAWQAYVNRWPRYRHRVEEQYYAARRALAGSIAIPADIPVGRRPASGTKIGRNQPCPCGSGRKYKRCCLPKQRRL